MKGDIDDPYISYESFPSLPRVLPALNDAVAGMRRAKYQGKKRHAADIEGDGDACIKAFFTTAGLTRRVLKVVCSHLTTLGFRVLLTAEIVGEALYIFLERFPSLPSVIFYDVFCKICRERSRPRCPLLSPARFVAVPAWVGVCMRVVNGGRDHRCRSEGT